MWRCQHRARVFCRCRPFPALPKDCMRVLGCHHCMRAVCRLADIWLKTDKEIRLVYLQSKRLKRFWISGTMVSSSRVVLYQKSWKPLCFEFAKRKSELWNFICKTALNHMIPRFHFHCSGRGSGSGPLPLSASRSNGPQSILKSRRSKFCRSGSPLFYRLKRVIKSDSLSMRRIWVI